MSKRPLKNIKSGTLSRGLALARASFSAGAKAATHTVGNLFASQEEKADRFKSLLASQAQTLAAELGQLKGSLMKMGQLLSTYGEHFLPPEANQFLKALQNESPPLEWPAIHKVLLKQLGEEKLKQLEVDPQPLASASLGQVHKAKRKSDGKLLALKIQYPGVDDAIEGDLRALKTILTVSKLIPKGPNYEELFKEVRMMLHQETDYTREFELTQEFRELLKDDPRFIIPEPIEEFSTKRILATTLEHGVSVDSPEVHALSQERRNAIGQAVLELYFKELFQWRMMQTDPHFGNYRVRIGQDQQPDQLVLLDFGAVRKFSKQFLDAYTHIVRGAFLRDAQELEKGARALGFILDNDSPELAPVFCDLCYAIMEPFSDPPMPQVDASLFDSTGAYDWGRSDLPKRVAKKGAQMVLKFKPHVPPREIVFLDRKMGGMFVFQSVLKTRFRARELLGSVIGL